MTDAAAAEASAKRPPRPDRRRDPAALPAHQEPAHRLADPRLSRWSASARRRWRSRWPSRPSAELLANPMKQVQGGYLCAMLDECMSVACMVASKMTAVAPTVEMKTSFFRPAAPGPMQGRRPRGALGQDHRLHRGRALRRQGPAAWPRPPAPRCRRRSRTTSRPMRPWLAALAFALAGAVLGLAGGASAETAGPFADWAAVVVSGDFHAAHTNNPTETFDNARRDVSAELIRKGFSPTNLRAVLGAAGALPGHQAGQGRPGADLPDAEGPRPAAPRPAAWSTSPRTARRRAWC